MTSPAPCGTTPAISWLAGDQAEAGADGVPYAVIAAILISLGFTLVTARRRTRLR